MTVNFKQPSNYHTFILSPGYVEESRLGALVLSREDIEAEEAETAEEAWTVNFSSLQAVFKKASSPSLSPCCSRHLKESPTFQYCPQCGYNFSSRGEDEGEMEEDLHAFFINLLDCTVDDAVQRYREFYMDLEAAGWFFGLHTEPGILTMVEHAERTMCLSPQEVYRGCYRITTEVSP